MSGDPWVELAALQHELGDLSLLIPTVDDPVIRHHLERWHAVLTKQVEAKERSVKRPPRKKAETWREKMMREASERVAAKAQGEEK